MSPLTLRTDFGCTEAVIDYDCGLKRFYEVANILSDDLGIKFTQKTDDFDSLMRHCLYKGHILTLHYNIISCFPVSYQTVNGTDQPQRIVIFRCTGEIHSRPPRLSSIVRRPPAAPGKCPGKKSPLSTHHRFPAGRIAAGIVPYRSP